MQVEALLQCSTWTLGDLCVSLGRTETWQSGRGGGGGGGGGGEFTGPLVLPAAAYEVRGHMDTDNSNASKGVSPGPPIHANGQF